MLAIFVLVPLEYNKKKETDQLALIYLFKTFENITAESEIIRRSSQAIELRVDGHVLQRHNT